MALSELLATHDEKALQALSSGEAWRDFCDAIAEAGSALADAGGPSTEIDLAESHRYLTRLLRAGLEQIMEGGDARRPAFFESLHETLKSGWDNPDNIHTNAYISGQYQYRIRGTRGQSHYMTIAVYGGSLGREEGRRTIAYVDVDSLAFDEKDQFEVTLSRDPVAGNWIALAEDATTVMIRQTFWEKHRENAAHLSIERVTDQPPPPLDATFVTAALRRTTRFVRGTNQIFFEYARRFRQSPLTTYSSDPKNSSTLLGIPEMRYLSGWWSLERDRAIVVEVDVPQCRYWSFVLSNYWGESFDYQRHQVHTNQRRARYRPGGSLRFVISEIDPELADSNWLDPCHHPEGLWTLRWLEAAEHPVPKISVVPVGSLA